MNKILASSLFLCFAIICSNGFSQTAFTVTSNTSLAEKIYLQLDREIYTTGSTIWFKSIVTKSIDNTPTDLSGVLYVELINAEKNIIEKKLIKLNEGIGDGYFDLPETLPAGNYIIRAYTEWNKNFDRDFFFEKYVQVFSIYDIKTNNQQENQTQIAVEENPQTTSTINTDIDLQFLPESGELVHGLSSKVGFKALNSFGTGIPVEGTVFDDDNNQLATFKSNALGMGSFQLDSVNGNRTYHAKLKNTYKIHPLPKATFMGNVIWVVEKDKIITINTSSNYKKTDSIYLNVSFRGTTLHELKAPLKNGTLKFLFSSNELPEGIIAFKMMDNHKRTMAERLYFNKRLGNDLNIKIATNKPTYSKRELTNLTLETTNNKGELINANASILVINKKELGQMQSLRDNILSYFLLSSELKGDIENPGYYFSNNNNVQNDLDALMLTQGWRQYKYNRPFVKFNFKPESNLTISGKALLTQNKSESYQSDLTMITYGRGEVLYMQTTDSLGHFKFDLEDEFGENVKVLVSAKQFGKRVGVNFLIDEKKSPPIEFNQKIFEKQQITTNEAFIKKAIEKKKIETDFHIHSGNIALDEVVVTGRKLTPIQQKVIDRFGGPDIIIEGTEIKEKEKNWSSGIYDILHYNFRDKVIIKRDSVGNQSIISLNGMITLVVIDGIPVFGHQYPNLQHIQADQVTSIEVIEFAKSFKRFYGQVFPEKFGAKSPAQGNIVAIYTKVGKGIHGAYARKSKSLGETTIPVFSETKTFYTPKYDKITAEDLEWPDLRSLIHWQPILKTDNSGKTEISFYNGDNTGDMMVIVEAISDNGAIGYQEYTYKVE
ncbi:hypothetical protein [Confluentibacter citreus]|uniref:hypothetical protein n=1 Tax=Confluentibacter citreus TaxID=2007307 RepID=UPI000C28B73F|nr:hypothetical protein [Confluentibacter citreus]